MATINAYFKSVFITLFHPHKTIFVGWFLNRKYVFSMSRVARPAPCPLASFPPFSTRVEVRTKQMLRPYSFPPTGLAASFPVPKRLASFSIAMVKHQEAEKQWQQLVSRAFSYPKSVPPPGLQTQHPFLETGACATNMSSILARQTHEYCPGPYA